jgi:hypothetical protein
VGCGMLPEQQTHGPLTGGLTVLLAGRLTGAATEVARQRCAASPGPWAASPARSPAE